jgi:hypothetical protein
MKSFTSSLSSIVFHGNPHTVGPDNAVVGTVKVAVRFALLDEDPETTFSAVSKHHFCYNQSIFSNIQCMRIH